MNGYTEQRKLGDVGVKTSSTLVMKIRQGVISGEWDERAARVFDQTYRPYLLGYLRTSRWKGFWRYHDEIVSQTFVRLFPYIAKGWERHGTGAFRQLLKTIVDRGAAQDVIREELDLMETDESDEDGKRKKVPRNISIEQMGGRDDDGRKLSRDEQIEMARRLRSIESTTMREQSVEERDFIRWHKETLFLAIVNVLGEVEDRDDRIVWERLVERRSSKDVAREFGVTDNNVNVITSRKLGRINQVAKGFMDKYVYRSDEDPDMAFKSMWKKLAQGKARDRVGRIEQAIARQLAIIEENEQVKARR